MGKKKIIVSSHSGFCFGVRRALNIAERALKTRSRVYSLGPIIHNPQVVNEFSKKGLTVARHIGRIQGRGVTVLIPSHGVSPDVLKNKRIKFIDTTCPLVERVQSIVKDLKRKGFFIVIVGDKKHPEVKGLAGIAGENSRVVKNGKEAWESAFLPKGRSPQSKGVRKIALISQTTASLSSFREVLAEIAKKDFSELISFNTVCKNTIDRQREAQRIAEKVDVMVIIGGKNSANTSKLAQTCKMVNKDTYHIESKDDIQMKLLARKKTIGIATGASTPPYAIQEVIDKINEAVTSRGHRPE